MTESLSQRGSHAPGVTKILAFMLALYLGSSAQLQSSSGTPPPPPDAAKTRPQASSPLALQSPPQCLARPAVTAPPGLHSVILTWKASPSSNAMGYCLYRRKTPHIPKKITDCKDCEGLNSVPIKGTGCIDDKVPDGVTYYYVATAINQHSDMSEVSNEATPTKKPIPPGTFPSCRAN